MPYLAGQIAIILLPVALLFFGLGYWSRGFLGKSSTSAPVKAGLGSELRSQDDELPAPAPVTVGKEAGPEAEEKGAAEAESEPSDVGDHASTGGTDDFTKIKGIGPATAKKLQELGVGTYAQLAEWPESEAVKAGFADRSKKHKWREQAASMT
ncbi:MAG: hypothetical protein AAGJ79_03700 [Verrucomicrobiota bacterium]